eukprot:7008420-Pyramimonas_sp.AAC.1
MYCTGFAVQYMRGTNVQNASCQRCEHPGFLGASSVCNVRVPRTYPSPVRSAGVQRSRGRSRRVLLWGARRVLLLSLIHI